MVLVIGAGDTNSQGTVYGGSIPIGPHTGTVSPPPQLHGHFQGWLDRVFVWDGGRTCDELHRDMTRRFTRAEITTLAADADPRLVYAFSVDDVPDPDHSPTSPPGFAAVGSRPADYNAIAWWSLAPHRSLAYTDYRYVPWVENMASHSPRDPPMDSTLSGINISNAYPNTCNPYHFTYRHGLSAAIEKHPCFLSTVVSPTEPQATTDLLLLGGAVADEDVVLWDGASGRDPFDTDGDGLMDRWEEVYALDPINTNGVNGGRGDRDGDGISNIEEQELGTSPRSVDTDGDGTPDSLRDTDGDGMPDRGELIAGTSWTNGLDVFRVLAFDIVSNSEGDTVHWNSFTGRLYAVYGTESVAGTWSQLDEVEGVGGPQAYTNPVPSLTRHYYRLGVRLRE